MSVSKQTSAQKAVQALNVYLERGKLALAAMDKDDTSEFLALLDKRRAAFHNFRALDHLAQSEGVDLAHDPEVKRIWNEIRATNSLLQKISGRAVSDMESQTKRLSIGRSVSQKYGSGSFTPCKLRKIG